MLDFLAKNTALSLAFPVIENKNDMQFYPWRSKEPTIKNRFGIKEPISKNKSPLQADKRTLVCVPCLAVDLKGNRLGYGGGFYDRYLEKNPTPQTVAISYARFVQNIIPQEKWDIPIQMICTEKELKGIKNA